IIHFHSRGRLEKVMGVSYYNEFVYPKRLTGVSQSLQIYTIPAEISILSRFFNIFAASEIKS
ncbi:MAG: hypothetical protein ACI3ZC_10755, partial [Candidatus Cryptobacteroides sp.]